MCMQASNLSTLWLEEMHLENTMPRYRQPLAHSMPWQLANHALVYPQEQLTEVQYSPCLEGADGLLLNISTEVVDFLSCHFMHMEFLPLTTTDDG